MWAVQRQNRELRSQFTGYEAIAELGDQEGVEGGV